MPLRVAAISFLNPAPLLYNFEHAPAAAELRTRYTVHHTLPARCAAQLHAGEADLGLIPVAELTPDLRIVPGCTIASPRVVRSILLLVRSPPGQAQPDALRAIRRVAADRASRSSTAYLRVLLGRFYGVAPVLVQRPADPLAMLRNFDAALLIGDPALLARERRDEIDRAVAAGSGQFLHWIDIAQLWNEATGLPWVAAVWAVRPDALRPPAMGSAGITPAQLIADLNASRVAGLGHIEEIVREWTPRLALSPETIRTYLTENIRYDLNAPCIEAIRQFRAFAADLNILPPLPELCFLTADPPHEPPTT